MKKYFLGLVAAILAISLSSFGLNNDSTDEKTDLYWFTVNSSYGDQTEFLDNEVSRIPGSPSSTPPTNGCEGGDYKCIVGFTEDQLNPMDFNHLNDTWGRQPIVDIGALRLNP